MSIFSQDSSTSVGARLAASRVVTGESAKFVQLTSRLAASVRELVGEEIRRVSSAKAVVLPYQISPDVFSELSDTYREFAVKQVPITKPVHAEFEAGRALALAYAGDFCAKYSEDVIVLGNVMLNTALSGSSKVHMEMHGSNAVAVHANHEASLVYTKMARAAEALRVSHGLDVSFSDYKEFCHGRLFQTCVGSGCSRKAGAYVVDGSMYPMSLDQFAAGMLTSTAEVGVMLVPYHPDMFRAAEGLLPMVGVGYKIGKTHLDFMYPEGLAGATRWETPAWMEWLASSVRDVRTPTGVVRFMVELRAHRGMFLFATVVRVSDSSARAPARLVHALELTWPRKMVVCHNHQLKGLEYDPQLASSWEKTVDYFPEVIVNDLYHHAMGLPQDRFTWEALLKRALVADGRVTYQGAAVRVQQPLSDGDAKKLTFLIYSRAFVDRYKVGRLGSEMMKMLSAAAGFGTASSSARIYMVMSEAWKQSWTATRVAVTDYMRDFVIGMLDSRSVKARLGSVDFLPAPCFVTYESYVAGLKRHWSFLWHAKGAHVTVPGVRGDTEAWRLFGGAGRSCGVDSLSHPEVVTSGRTGKIVDDIVEMREPGETSVAGKEVVDMMGDLNQMGRSPFDRLFVRMTVATPEVVQSLGPERFEKDDSFVSTINEVHEAMFPGMAQQDFEQDARSLAIGGQARAMESLGMKLPFVNTVEGGFSDVYKSRLKTYAVEKRAQTAAELLSALSARTLTVPVVAVAQDDAVLIPRIWENFLDTMCVPGVRAKLKGYQEDVVSLERELAEEWTMKARPEVLQKMLLEMARHSKSLEEMSVDDYLVMLKSDAKPPMSDKPMKEQVAPQVIVYHDKVLSALYSSIFRVLVRRFLSLLRPEIMVNLLKDGDGIRDHIAANHPWGTEGLQYLENDFGKYDKSQHEFAFMLEHYVFQQLGMQQALLDKWTAGHETCSLRSVSLGIRLTVSWQRKSGDATTAFGNVIINILSTAYAYAGSKIEWAVYMGDDSLVCVSVVCATPKSLQVLAEVFNLQAKFYLGAHPYFASNFVLLDGEEKQVRLAPDPIKRVQKWAVSISAVDPRWEDRYRSQRETCAIYRHADALNGLEESVRARYPVPYDVNMPALFAGIASAVDSQEEFRSMYTAEPVRVWRTI